MLTLGILYFGTLTIGGLLKRTGKSHAVRMAGNVLIIVSFFLIAFGLWQYWLDRAAR
jgi:hypothetical protein